MISEEARLYLVLTILSSALLEFFQITAKITSEDGSCLTHNWPAWCPVCPALCARLCGRKTGSIAVRNAPVSQPLATCQRSTQGEQKALVKLRYFDEGLGID